MNKNFIRSSFIALIAVYVLILIGGLVRSTGSGMGCPDWPKCFGRWIPPTCQCELPANYQEFYKTKFIHTVEFNPYNTWMEYFNRLFGALVGVFVFISFLFSIPFLKKDKTIFFISLLTLFLVGFQGWLGAVVVSTNLAPWMVTIHMLVALVIVALLIFTIYRAWSKKQEDLIDSSQKKKINITLSILLISFLIQVGLGTQVREAVDSVILSFPSSSRSEWIGYLDRGIVFLIHRSFSWVLLLLSILLVRFLIKEGKLLKRLGKGLIFLLALEIISGIGMMYFSIPPFLQPIHLVLSSLTFGVQFFLLLQINKKKEILPSL